MKPPKVYTQYDHPEDPGIDCSVEPSMTQQNFRDECDINNILAKYQLTGLLPNSDFGEGSFLDVASAVDYHAAQNLIVKAAELFGELPAKVRKRFNNDPEQLLVFLDNPENRDEAVQLGLIKASDKPAAASPAGSSGNPRAGDAAKPAGGSEPSQKGDKGGT